MLHACMCIHVFVCGTLCLWLLLSKHVPVIINHIAGLTMPSGCSAQSGRVKPALPSLNLNLPGCSMSEDGD